MLAAVKQGRPNSIRILVHNKPLPPMYPSLMQPCRQLGYKKIDRHVFIEDLTLTAKRNLILFKSRMISRKMSFRNPFSGKKFTVPISISDLAGHGSFLFLALSYMESDFMNLRMYATSGITLSIIFQYYREKPLWIPIRWNSLFLLINAVMLGLLMKAEQDASNIPEEQKALYHKVFEYKGMKSVDFLRLISCATKLECKKGEKLVAETKKNTRVYLVKKGHLSVYRKDQKVGVINANQFVGAMSFLSWQDDSRVKASIAAEVNTQEAGANKPATQVQVDINGLSMIQTATQGDSTGENSEMQSSKSTNKPTSLGNWLNVYENVYTFMFGTTNSEGNASSTMQSSENTAKSTDTSSLTTSTINVQTVTPSNLVTPATIQLTAENKPAPAKKENTFLDKALVQTSNFFSSFIVQEPNPGGDDHSSHPLDASSMEVNDPTILEEGLTGRANVICEEDCVVYYWSFKDLHSLVQEYPVLGYVFERCISDDLNKKMTTSWDEELKHRYKQLLYGVILGGEVKEEEKIILENFREIYHITLTDHEAILAEFDWKTEEYTAGYKGAPHKDVIEEYLSLLTMAVRPEGGGPRRDGFNGDDIEEEIDVLITPEMKEQLRNYRIKHYISTDLHLQLLKNLGWSYDEFEVGSKDLSIVKKLRDARIRKRQQAIEKKQQELNEKKQILPNTEKATSAEGISDSTGNYWDTTGPYVPFPVVSWIRSALFSSYATTTKPVISNPVDIPVVITREEQVVSTNKKETERTKEEEEEEEDDEEEPIVRLHDRHAYLHHANKAFETTTSS